MITPPLMPLIVSSKRFLKVIAVVLPCLCIVGFLGRLVCSLNSWEDDGMTEAQWAAEALGYDLLHAVQDENLFAVNAFLKQGGNVNDAYGSPLRSLLMIAAEQGDLPTVKYLLHAGADVLHSEKGETALTLAKEKHYAKVIDCLEQAEERAYSKLVARYGSDYLADKPRTMCNMSMRLTPVKPR